MKKAFTLLVFVLITVGVIAQAPQKMSFQIVLRDNSGNLLTELPVGMQISILQGTVDGTVVYSEVQSLTTNINGLVSTEIGGGSGFETIDWTDGPYFIKTEADPTGGSNYIIERISELLSVPYAMHSKTAETVIDLDFSAISDWNEAHGWGDHSQEGYLTNENDPSVPIGTQTAQIQYWDGTAWVTLTPGEEGEVLHFCNGIPTWGTCFEDVQNPLTGKTWMDRNLGASRVATSDGDIHGIGDLYQWGRPRDGHEKRTSQRIFDDLSESDIPGHGSFICVTEHPFDWRIPHNSNLWQGVNGINNPCPSGYRLPTQAEWEAERHSWASNNSEGAFSSPLKLPLGGLRNFNAGLTSGIGLYTAYWSSTVHGNNLSWRLYFHHDNATVQTQFRASGNSVRCIKD